uniref:Testis-expressed protein 19.2-like n=1 Tax=Nannospalax galili TaxID=1026970 RepID=A0A8C6W5A3_NANGA
MCPPVRMRHGAKGLSCLYAAWLYQLVHGDQMQICFACFKAAFLVVKNMLEMGDWEMWSPESSEFSETESEEDTGSEQDEWLEFRAVMVGLGPQSMPTELEPQEAIPLDLGPEHAEWTQTLPWRFDGLSPCSHWLIPPLSWGDIFSLSPSPGQPVLLELSPTWPMDPVEAEAWLVELKFVFLLGSFSTTFYLLSMTPCWAVRIPVQRWQVLLHSGEARLARLQNAPQQEDVQRWKLSILEPSELGIEMVPADCSLRKGGFTLHSYLPWQNGTPEAWSWEPRERLHVTEVVPLSELPLFHPSSPEPHN